MGRNFLLIITIFYTCVYSNLNGQDTLELSHQITLPDSGKITIDQMGILYLIKGLEVIKLDKKGSVLNRYSNNILGDITHIDVSNPLQILLFYRDQSQIVFLDNTLSEQKQGISALHVSDAYITQSCNSNNGGFWVYNATNLELQKRDKSSGLSSSSNNLSLVVGENIEPTFLKESNNIIQVLTDSALFLFDNKVNFIKKLPLKGRRFLNYHHEIFTSQEQHYIYFLDTQTFENKKYYIPYAMDSAQIYSTHHFVYLLEGKNLKVFVIPKGP